MDEELRALEQKMKRDFSDDDAFTRYLTASGRGGTIKDVPDVLCDYLRAFEQRWSDMLKRRVVEVARSLLQPFPGFIFATTSDMNPNFIIHPALAVRRMGNTCDTWTIEPDGIYRYASREVHLEDLLGYRERQSLCNPGIFGLQGHHEHRNVYILPTKQEFQALLTISQAGDLLQSIRDRQMARDNGVVVTSHNITYARF